MSPEEVFAFDKVVIDINYCEKCPIQNDYPKWLLKDEDKKTPRVLGEFAKLEDAVALQNELQRRFDYVKEGFQISKRAQFVVLATGNALNLHFNTLSGFCVGWITGRNSR